MDYSDSDESIGDDESSEETVKEIVISWPVWQDVIPYTPPPTAERIRQRKAEQQRRRREVLVGQIDLTMQSDVMHEFEEALKATKDSETTSPQHTPTSPSEESQDDFDE